MPHAYSFSDRLNMSQGVSVNKGVQDILLANIPGALQCIPAHKENDRNGTDWWVECKGAKFLSVDCKIRSKDYAINGSDDLALESWSVVEKEKVGWTRDANKQTDFVLWYWEDTCRWVLIPFPMLCAVFRDKWSDWLGCYKNAQQHTPSVGGGYHSQCVFVPRKVVWREIYLRYSGNPEKVPEAHSC